ncbi:ATP-binding response regulator [Desulfohalovibrio reitneri]|uniref:ATP-binding response regulator n=1 Tax=Desulfohalovibrio reitneri TaxID=1307759 RepID=UPI0004A6AA5F|nr:response regulator [Desulfohalovibrio reitneri]
MPPFTNEEPTTYRILAVDDEEGFLALYRDILCLEEEETTLLSALQESSDEAGPAPARQRFDLTLCRSGEEAVERMREAVDQGEAFVVALVDVRLGSGMDGVETAQRLREMDELLEIVVVTAYNDISLSELNRRIQPPERLLYLQKPFRPQELRQLALSLCTKWQAELQYRDLNSILWETVEDRTAELNGANEQLRRDIAERQRMLEQLARSEERYRLLFEEDITGNFTASPDGRVLECNEAFARAFDFPSAEEAKGFSVLDVPLEGLEGRSLPGVLREQGSLRGLETSLRRDSGRVDLIASFNGVFNGAGELVEIRGYFYDITERRELEEQLRLAQKMEALGTLAGGIAHDFNNILGVILGYAEIVLEGAEKGSGLARRVGEIVTAGHRARDLVNQILNFSRQAGQERNPLHVTPLVKEALKLLRSGLSASIDMRTSFRTNDDLVEADPTQLHQILLNLCANAAHAMSEEGGRLEVELADEELGESERTDLPAGRYLRLTVRDTGHGMEPEVLERIFDPFFTTKKPGEGTGMGLSVVHGVVASHQGGVEVESALGGGTAFHVFLPKAEGVAAPADAESPGIILPPARVMLVDDEAALVDVGLEMLASLGLEGVGCQTGGEALERLRSGERVDVLLTDQNMPGMTGLQLAEESRRLRPDLPVLLCTGFSETISEEAMRQVGVTDCLMKPLLSAKLAEGLSQVLN